MELQTKTQVVTKTHITTALMFLAMAALAALTSTTLYKTTTQTSTTTKSTAATSTLESQTSLAKYLSQTCQNTGTPCDGQPKGYSYYCNTSTYAEVTESAQNRGLCQCREDCSGIDIIPVEWAAGGCGLVPCGPGYGLCLKCQF